MTLPIRPPVYSDQDIALVRDSFEQVSMQLVPVAADFYDRLFKAQPEVRGLFAPDMAPQVAKLAHTLSQAVQALSYRDSLVEELRELGHKHRGYGVRAHHYPVLTECLLETLGEALGRAWTDETATAWRRVLGFVGSTMLQGARDGLRRDAGARAHLQGPARAGGTGDTPPKTLN